MPRARIHDVRIISTDPSYHGWPTVGRRRSGELLVVSSAGRQDHVCPYGQVHMIRSSDGGLSWSAPHVLVDGPLDDRDCGVTETSRGTLLVNWFTSVTWMFSLVRNESGESLWLTREQMLAWGEIRRRLVEDGVDVRAELGHFCIRSTDGGQSWSERIPAVANTPHGPIELSDGTLFYAGKKLDTPNQYRRGNPHGGSDLGAAVSHDDGLSWQWFSTIAPPEGQEAGDCHEPHAVEAANGDIVVQIRSGGPRYPGETLQCESSDGGRTWSPVRSIGVWGQPSHLLRLADGRLLMTYGYRREPYGNQARVSENHGRSWSEPMTISSDGCCGDLGYPSTVQLGDGSLAAVWYEALKDNPQAVLRMARWSLED